MFRIDEKEVEWECHGCGRGRTTKVVGIDLPHLCNQNLYLCPKCREKLEATLRSLGITCENCAVVETLEKIFDGAINERTLPYPSDVSKEIKKFYAAQIAILLDMKTALNAVKHRKLKRTKLTAFQSKWLKIHGYLKPRWLKEHPELAELADVLNKLKAEEGAL